MGEQSIGEMQTMGAEREWERYGIKLITQLYQEGILKTFQELREQFALPNKQVQVRHALEEQFQYSKK